jgi:putative membrane protein
MSGTGGFLAEHMATHILAMNVAAPLLVLATRRILAESVKTWLQGSIAPASAIQIVLLWGWHLPGSFAFAAASSASMAAMHISLFAVALWFWASVVVEAEKSRWRSLGALLITGKLFCLLGVLLAFAPRPLYAEAAVTHGMGHMAMNLLPDQQLAGLLMLVACPLTYVLAGIIIAARWIADIERTPSWSNAGSGA